MYEAARNTQLRQPAREVDGIRGPGDGNIHQGLIQAGLMLEGIVDAIVERKCLDRIGCSIVILGENARGDASRDGDRAKQQSWYSIHRCKEIHHGRVFSCS